jgi:VWFA-related protein
MLQQPMISVDVRLAQIIATVSDSEGHLVPNLDARDFILEEDGIPQDIPHIVQDSETPVSIGILLDTSLSMRAGSKISGAVAAARAFLRVLDNRNQDEVQLMTFTTRVHVKRVFTEDRTTIDEALLKIKDPIGGTLIYSSVTQALKLMTKARNRKRALIVITDAETGEENVKKFRQRIRESEALIYTIGIRGVPMGASPSNPRLRPPTLPQWQEFSCGRGRVPWVFCGERLPHPNRRTLREPLNGLQLRKS